MILLGVATGLRKRTSLIGDLLGAGRDAFDLLAHARQVGDQRITLGGWIARGREHLERRTDVENVVALHQSQLIVAEPANLHVMSLSDANQIDRVQAAVFMADRYRVVQQ